MNAQTAQSYDVLIIGGGVIGLSLAWELAQQGARVCLLERGPLGQQASWAGAGMIPPGVDPAHQQTATPWEQLAGISQTLHPQWHQRLLEETGIDSQYRQLGAVQLAWDDDQAQLLQQKIDHWRALGIACHRLESAALAELEPALAPLSPQVASAWHLPEEAQIRNPRHLQALIAACRQAGVDLRPQLALREFRRAGSRITGALTAEGPIEAEQICLTAGCWSGHCLAPLGIELPVRPVRGQIVLLEGTALRRTIAVGSRYLVPRLDGPLLIGSTEEEAGFSSATTPSGVEALLRFAHALVPALAELPVTAQWAGLRPATVDGLPYLGRLPGWDNGWIATGHFRSGLQLSPATAVVMRALLLGQTPAVDVSSLGLDRTIGCPI